jgi:hypothetical protein
VQQLFSGFEYGKEKERFMIHLEKQ